MEEFKDYFNMFQTVTGVLLPLVISFFMKQSWSKQKKAFFAFGTVFLVSMLHTIVIHEFSLADIAGSMLKIFFLMVTTYIGFWKPTGAAGYIESKWGLKDRST